MEATGNLWLVGLFCTALGALLGYAAALVLTPGTSNNRRDLASRLQQSHDELKNYRMEVNAHFMRTAELLNQLHGQYREVHNHVAQGAQALCDHQGPPLLSPLADHGTTTRRDNGSYDPGHIRAPLDYAPKATQHDRGILREDFGLDKPSVKYEPSISTHYQLEDDELDERDETYTGLPQSKN